MAKLQIQLNGKQGLAPKHFGNSLYSTNDPHLRYMGKSGQMASGIWSSDRYDGFISPMPNQYQTCHIEDLDPTKPSVEPIQMAYSNRNDEDTNIVLGSADSIYYVQEQATIDGVTGDIDFYDSYSSPVFKRKYGEEVLKRYIYENTKSQYNSLVMIDSTHCIIAYQENDNGIIKTFSIDGDYKFTEIDSDTHETAGAEHNSLVMIDSTHFALAYNKDDDTGVVKIFSIDASHVITEVSTIDFSVDGTEPSLIFLGDTNLVVAYEGVLSDGYIIVLGFNDSTYSLSSSEALEHDIVNGEDVSLIKIDDTHVMLAYQGADSDGYIKTFRINIAATVFNTGSAVTDSVVNNGNSVIKITDSMVAVASSGESSDGYIRTFSVDINGNFTLLDTLEHDINECFYPSLALIDSTHVALAYENIALDSIIKTFEIDSNGNITELALLNHEGVGTHHSLITLGSTHLALAFRDSGNDGNLKTFSLDGSYNITEIDSLIYDTSTATSNSLVMIDSTHLAVAYVNGKIRILSLDASYNISLLSYLAHDTVGNANSLTLLDSTHLALAYRGVDGDGFIKTFSLDGSYNITQIDVLEHDILDNEYNSLISVGVDKLQLSYEGNGSDAHFKTFSLDGSYNITQTGNVEFDTTGSFNSLIELDTNRYIVAYKGVGNIGRIKSFIAASTTTELDSLEHDTDYNSDNSLVQIDATHYMLAYSNEDGDGILKTFSIDGSHVITEIDSLNHDSLYVIFNSLIKIDSTHFMLSYRGTSAGYTKTFSIDGSHVITEIDSFEHGYSGSTDFNSLVMIDSTNFMLAYTQTSGVKGYLSTFAIDSNYEFDFVNYLQVENIHDVTRSQHAGSPAYYYTWGDKIGRCETLSDLGTNDYELNVVDWIGVSSNPGSLVELRSTNPTLANGNNQYVYVIDGTAIHGINVSPSGTSTDVDGTFDSDLLIFQAGVQLIDAVEDAGRMYVSMIEGSDDIDLFNLPDEMSTSTRCSVYIWNKISSQQLQANEIPLSNCKHVGRIWVMDGSVYVMTINSANISEIRILSGGKFKVLHEIGGDNEFNIGKQSVEVTDIGTIIATNKGNLWLLNKSNSLVKLGVFATSIEETAPTLVIYGGGAGHEPSNLTQGLESVVPNLTIVYKEGGITPNDKVKIVKFFLHNHGIMTNEYKDATYTTEQQTWLDTNVPDIELKANQGDVYSLVNFLPKLSEIKDIYVPCKPVAGVSKTIEIAKIKVYLNNSPTAFHEHSISQFEANKGYITIPINKANVNAVQLEVEYNTEQVMGENDFAPAFALAEYIPTRTGR